MLTIPVFGNGECETRRVGGHRVGSDGSQIWTRAGWLKSTCTYVPGALLSTGPHYARIFIYNSTSPGLPSPQDVIQWEDASDGSLKWCRFISPFSIHLVYQDLDKCSTDTPFLKVTFEENDTYFKKKAKWYISPKGNMKIICPNPEHKFDTRLNPKCFKFFKSSGEFADTTCHARG